MKYTNIFFCCLLFILSACSSENDEKVPRVSFDTVLKEVKNIDKLYTGIYMIPIIDIKYGNLKRDVLKKGDTVPKGFCMKRYEVSLGYENLSMLLNDKGIIENACRGKIRKLPDPQILSVISRESKHEGDYDGNGACYKWDRAENVEMRNNLIKQHMDDYKILDRVNKRGKEALKSIAKHFCE